MGKHFLPVSQSYIAKLGPKCLLPSDFNCDVVSIPEPFILSKICRGFRAWRMVMVCLQTHVICVCILRPRLLNLVAGVGLDLCIWVLIKIKYLGTKFCRSSLSTSLISCNFVALIYFIIVISINGSLNQKGTQYFYGFLLSC